MSATLWTYLAVIGGLVAVVLLCGAFFALKLHLTIRRLGSFTCRYRPDIHSGWTEGVAVYGTEELTWYRLVSFSLKPQLTWSRRNLEIKNATAVGGTANEQIMELRIHADGHRFFLEVSAADYNGLVSWIEAGPPRSASFL